MERNISGSLDGWVVPPNKCSGRFVFSSLGQTSRHFALLDKRKCSHVAARAGWDGWSDVRALGSKYDVSYFCWMINVFKIEFGVRRLLNQ